MSIYDINYIKFKDGGKNKMKLDKFIGMMTGHFDNKEQFDIMQKAGKIYPYAELKKSEKFTPALYHEKNGIWEGGSISQFSPVMTFKLWEKFSDSCLEVSESMEVNGKRTFGYDEPIIYKRI